NIVTQVIVLRLINVALGVITLFLLWKLLKLLRISSALANVILVAFAFTPLVGDLFAQISYDNLLLPAVLVCTYETIVLTRQLRRGSFDSRAGLLLLAFCLFASLIKYAFLPIFAGIVVLVGWGVVSSWRTDAAGLMATARKTFAAISGRAKLALLAACLLSLGLCIKMYGVNLVRYHTPVPQCNQVLNARDCHHYYAWDYNYRVKSYNQAHHTARMSLLHYTGIWITINLSEPFVALIPLIATPTYTFPVYLIAVWLLGTLAFACTVVNFKKLLQNRDLLALTFISFVYICSLWARNYHDFLRMGQPVALHARYLLPVLVYLYILLAVGVHSGLDGLRQHMALAAKTALALVLIVTFVCGGGFVQYVHYIYPRYGRLGPSNGFELLDASQYQ
ncbi:MAG TPA: hypothetical protein VHA37_09675, partial [Candidatus Saccharimonadales bacterium]|nr:hypothetical protein [Candidatus Saccharimonadales bacterium]